eukprot:252616-Pyramimonas_sp.AAC.1
MLGSSFLPQKRHNDGGSRRNSMILLLIQPCLEKLIAYFYTGSRQFLHHLSADLVVARGAVGLEPRPSGCLLYTSDAADDTPCVEL